jgi:hypothetical protein
MMTIPSGRVLIALTQLYGRWPMSVDEYLTKTAGLLLTYKDEKNNRSNDKKLKDKVKEPVAHMVSAGADEKDFKGVSAMNDANHPFSIDTLHAYIHNRFFTPLDTHLVVAWDNAQLFFEKIWPCPSPSLSFVSTVPLTVSKPHSVWLCCAKIHTTFIGPTI